MQGKSAATQAGTEVLARCRMRMWLVIVGAIAVGTPDHGKVDRADVMHDAERGTATLSLALSTRDLVAQTVALTIDVPHGARVTGMTVWIGGARAEATAMSAFAAEERFREIVSAKRDPALLEQTESTRDYDRLTLQVFPVAKTSPARVEIVVEMPEHGDRPPRRHVTAFTSLLAGEPEPMRRDPLVASRAQVWWCDGRF